MTDTKPKCQNCGGKILPIIYGLPSPAMFNAAGNDEVFLGGCVLGENNPQWKCIVCGQTIGEE